MRGNTLEGGNGSISARRAIDVFIYLKEEEEEEDGGSGGGIAQLLIGLEC